MAVDFVGKGINLGVGALSGYLAKKDMDEAKTGFMDKKSNWLALGTALLGTGVEMWMPEYGKYAGPAAASGFTLLGRSLYFEFGVAEADRVPGVSEIPAGITLVPHAKGKGSHSRNYVPTFDNVEAT